MFKVFLGVAFASGIYLTWKKQHARKSFYLLEYSKNVEVCMIYSVESSESTVFIVLKTFSVRILFLWFYIC